MVKNLPANSGYARDLVSMPGSGRPSGIGNGNPLQYSCPEIPMNRGDWWATIHEVAKSETKLNNECVCTRAHTCTCTHTHTHITITPIFLEARGMLDKYSVIKGKHGSALLTVSHYFTSHAAAAAAKSLQSCPGSPVPGILQAKTLEWVAISFSNA